MSKEKFSEVHSCIISNLAQYSKYCSMSCYYKEEYNSNFMMLVILSSYPWSTWLCERDRPRSGVLFKRQNTMCSVIFLTRTTTTKRLLQKLITNLLSFREKISAIKCIKATCKRSWKEDGRQW